MADVIASTFDSIADNYEGLMRGSKYFSMEWIARHAHELESPPECRVLDLGCGTGLNTRALREQRCGVRADGVDLSPRMLDHARATGHFENLYTHDLNEPLTEVRSDEFDLVIAFGFSELLSRLSVCLSECRRVLKVDGWLWASFRRYEAEDLGSPPRHLSFGNGLTLTGYSAAEILHMMKIWDMRVAALEPVTAFITDAGFSYPYYILRAQKASE